MEVLFILNKYAEAIHRSILELEGRSRDKKLSRELIKNESVDGR